MLVKKREGPSRSHFTGFFFFFRKTSNFIKYRKHCYTVLQIFKKHFDGNFMKFSRQFLEELKPGTQDGSNYASCLADGDARTTSNICSCKRRLCWLTCMGHVRVLVCARKLKNFNFFGSSDAGWVKLQYFVHPSESFTSVLSVLLSFYQCC